MNNSTEKAFNGDKLNRQDYARGLIGFIEKLKSGVIAVDGEWGSGKSWLGINIKQAIDEKGTASTIWIDAFEADWNDDPSLSLIAGIANQVGNLGKAAFLENAASFLSRLIPAGTKAAAQAAGNFIGIDKDVSEGFSDAMKDASSAYVEQRLKDLTDRQQTLEKLKELLTAAVSKSETGKVVVLIDELDRCSPTFAIRFLERLKHLFNLEHVVYVLFWNRQQIQKAVEAFYGTGTDGQMYLDKFIDFPLYLPRSHIRGDVGTMRGILEAQLEKLDSLQRSALTENITWLNAVATLLSLTAREAQRLATWWVMSPNRNLVFLETWLLGLKVKRPDLFSLIRENNADGHLKAVQLLKSISVEENLRTAVDTIIDVHDRYHRNSFDDLEQHTIQILGRNYINPVDVIPAAIRRLETFN